MECQFNSMPVWKDHNQHKKDYRLFEDMTLKAIFDPSK
jgi:hypothetical protein